VTGQFLQNLPGFVLRGPIYIVFLILVSGLAYSCVGRVESKVASGLIVQGEEYVVESPVPGEVSFLDVDVGEGVGALAPLLSLFAPAAAADASELAQLRTDSAEARSSLGDLRAAYDDVIGATRRLVSGQPALRVANYRTALVIPADLADAAPNASPPAPDSPRRYSSLVESYRVRQLGALRDYVRMRAEQERAQARYDQAASLFAQRVISEPDFSGTQQQLTTVNAQVEQLANEFKASFHAAVSELEVERDRLVDRLRGVDSSIERVRLASSDVVVDRQHVHLRSRYPGVVSHVQVRALQPVAPGTELVKLQRTDVPKHGLLLVPNSAIGRVAVGQPVYVKFAAYPFQEYGVQTGRVVSISPEQTTVEGLGYGYEARIEFDAIRKGITLQYGMQGLAEIATGKRRIVELLLPPTARLFAALDG
jgi:multidrug resistance efflux pump